MGGEWVNYTLDYCFPLIFPIIELPCETVGHVTVETDSTGCLVATWDSLPYQEQWVVAMNADGFPSTVLDTVDACRWRFCGLPAGSQYQISVRSRCTQLRYYTWSEWSNDFEIGIDQPQDGGQLQITPNPTAGRVVVALSPYEPITEAYVVTLTGIRHRVPVSGNSIDLADFPSGILFLQLVTPRHIYTQKVVKTR